MELQKFAVRLIVRFRGHLFFFAEDGYEMYKGLLNTLVQPLFCSLNLLLGESWWCSLTS